MEDQQLRLLWDSNVPGSGAPECIMIAAVQAAANKGLNVEKAEKLLRPGLKALKEEDYASLQSLTGEIFYELNIANKDSSSPYWQYQQIESWEDHQKGLVFPEKTKVDINDDDFADRIYAGWLAQICGGAFGTCLEGYTSDNLKKHFGKVTDYIRKPNTFNDDITFELAFLEAFAEKGYRVNSHDIAAKWLALIPFGWSAESIALKNLKMGVFPPDSGKMSNPFSEWIGAQMRGTIVGMVCPGNPAEAARLAWEDGVVSHTTNGVLGETFNAMLASLAFVYQDVQLLLRDVIELIPDSSKYYGVIIKTLTLCMENEDWLSTWKEMEEALVKYNWIHSYPNAAAEIVALWYGKGDFDRTMEIIGACGQDVDCNAAQIASVLGVMYGTEILSEKWTAPIGDRLETYMRGMEELSIKGLTEKTIKMVQKHQ